MSTIATPSRSEILSLWQIQENLLQRYRAMFLSSQSLMLGLAAKGIDDIFAFSILAFLGLYITAEWTCVCQERALDVSYAQIMLAATEDTEERNALPSEMFRSFTRWQKALFDDKASAIRLWRSLNLEKKKAILRGDIADLGNVRGSPPESTNEHSGVRVSHVRGLFDKVLPAMFGGVWLILVIRALAHASSS